MTRMKQTKRVLACLAACAMITGCGSDSDADNVSGSGGSSSEKTSSEAAGSVADGSYEAAVDEVDIWASYPETVTLTTVLTADNFNDFLDGEDYDNNPHYNRWKELFNIDVENLWVAETSTDASTKMNLAMVDGTLPDVFTVDSDTLSQLVEAGVAMDITDVFNTYASDDVKSYMEADAQTAQSAWRDGRMYAIPQLSYGIINQVNHVWIRKDWKEEQNLSDPQTMDDLINIAKIFKEKYGAVIGEDQNLDSLYFLAPAWGAYPKIWIRTENGVEYGSVRPEMKEVLAVFAQWYQDGLLYQDFPTSDMTKMQQTNITGEVGIQPFYQWLAWTETDVVKNQGENAYFQAYEIPSATGKPTQSPINFANDGYVVINKTCEHPDAAIKLINYYVKTQFIGDEDREVLDELGRVGGKIPGSFRMYDPNCDYQQYVDMVEAVAKRDPSKLMGNGALLKYDNCIDYLDNKTPEAIGDYLQVGDEKCAYSVSKKVLDAGDWFYNVLWDVRPESLSDTGSALDDILLQGFTQIIVGERPLDYFDELVENWKAAGGDTVTAEMNEIYK